MNEEIIEDVTPVEDTPEQIEQQEAFFRSMIIGQYKNYLSDIYAYLMTNKLSIDDAIQEIQDKKSSLSTSRRSFLIGFKPKFIKQLMHDRYPKKF